jgi:[acyl-carrier-protein] S-malonyltransferase
MIAWMFPGQGSQRAGMAAGLEARRELFPRARDLISADLERVTSGNTWPPDVLQPALFATCVAAERALTSRGLTPEAVVGHSLGEFAALVGAGALDFEQGLQLVNVRGKAMAAAGRRHPGGMAAVIGLDVVSIEEICTEIGGVWVANINSPAQVVISGRNKALAQAANQCLQAGAARVIRLEVPIAGHSPQMEPAARQFEAAIADVELKEPGCAFYSVVDARPHTDPEEIRQLLVRGIVSPVRFAETLHAMHRDGAGRFIEVGPGRVLRGLVRQTLSDVEVGSVSSDDEAEALASSARAVSAAGDQT